MRCKSSSILISIVVIAVSGGFCLAACPSADLTGDCFVDYEDFALMANQWLTSDPCDPCIPDDMVLVPDGSFPYQNVSEPADWVYVDSFLIDKYECTNQYYCQFLNSADPNADHWDTNMEIDRMGDPGNYYFTVQSGRENYPIRYVSIYDAEAFATWRGSLDGLTYRLPTEQEWEKAAGWDPAEERYYTYGFHSDSIDCSWCNYNNCVGGPTVVGYYNGEGGRQDAKSHYGCYDMSGNLYEWTSSIYSSGSYRVIRGGSWSSSEGGCRVSYRGCGNPSTRDPSVGFRLALDFN